ncbi:MAG: hypothetical protein ACD_54C00127G0004 [uncultured bacterium]|nr:MAG: hypothetical protein ACD_54C00127G0004 [uncultured bacterium]MDO8328621.1 hypothetical protein [Cypionkella sp.]
MMQAIARTILIVLAAGNDCESQLIYPDALVADDNGTIAADSDTDRGVAALWVEIAKIQ